MRKFILITTIIIVQLFTSCREPWMEEIVNSTPTQVVYPDPEVGEIKGFYLLNEGNMGNNKCTLDFFDYETGIYTKNIYAERNPSVIKELGDVGNDIQVYKDRLYCVINCSNFVEVMDLATAKHIDVVSIPNCRFITFSGDYAYVSSYAGPVQVDPNARLGYVAKIDINTLKVVDTCLVGYQPDELVIVGDKLYVANSGGYRAPDYDNTLSVIDLKTFTEIKKIEVAPNLHGLELDRYGFLWISSRGDYYTVPSRTYVLDTSTDKIIKTLDIANSNMTRVGDDLYILSSEWSYVNEANSSNLVVVDTKSRKVVSSNFITDGTAKNIKKPYGLAVNPETKEVFVTDAKNYITPGKLHCYSNDGVLKWSVTTGDIPAHIVFTETSSDNDDNSEDNQGQGASAYITKVFDYMPAPGQLVNELPKYEEGDTQEKMNAKVLEAIGNNNLGMITLGSYGGYVTVGFDQTIQNIEGKLDFRVLGNAYFSAANSTDAMPGGSCEPGIIMVSADTNGNGQPDDEWYEIQGSAHRDHTKELFYKHSAEAGNDVEFYFRDFELTYTIPDQEPESGSGYNTYIAWSDNKGNSDYVKKNSFHKQPYYPQWIDNKTLKFSGSRLPQNSVDESGTGANFVLYKFNYGYADNAPNRDNTSAIDISWAVDASGKPANLNGVDFVKIYSGVIQMNGQLGETSTEICGITDLHINNEDIDSFTIE